MITVADVMTSSVYAFAQDTSIETAARLMTNRRIGGAPVIDSSGRPIGVISMVDIVDPDRPRTQRDGYPLFYLVSESSFAELGEDVSVDQGQVADIMSPFILSIESYATLENASKRMLAEGVHRLLVMDDADLVGIVTATDLLRGFVLRETTTSPVAPVKIASV